MSWLFDISPDSKVTRQSAAIGVALSVFIVVIIWLALPIDRSGPESRDHDVVSETLFHYLDSLVVSDTLIAASQMLPGMWTALYGIESYDEFEFAFPEEPELWKCSQPFGTLLRTIAVAMDGQIYCDEVGVDVYFFRALHVTPRDSLVVHKHPDGYVIAEVRASEAVVAETGTNRD